MTRSARRKFLIITCAPLLAVGLAVGVPPTATAASVDSCSLRTVDDQEIGRTVGALTAMLTQPQLKLAFSWLGTVAGSWLGTAPRPPSATPSI